MFASAKGKQRKYVRQLQSQEQCIDHIPYYLLELSGAHYFSDNLSRNSCMHTKMITLYSRVYRRLAEPFKFVCLFFNAFC